MKRMITPTPISQARITSACSGPAAPAAETADPFRYVDLMERGI